MSTVNSPYSLRRYEDGSVIEIREAARIYNRLSINEVRVGGQKISVRVLDGGELIGMGRVLALFLVPAIRSFVPIGLRDARLWIPFAALPVVCIGAALLLTRAHFS